MMIGTDPVSQLPIFTEDRPLGPYRALPRSVHDTIQALTTGGVWTVTYAKPSSLSGVLFVACWKCGRPLNGWHAATDRTGSPMVLPDGRAAAALGPLSHYRETRFAAYLPRVTAQTVYTVLHCADCRIAEEHGPETLAIHVAAHDQQQCRHRQAGQGVPPADWAQTCWKWGDAEIRRKVTGPLSAADGV